MPLQNDKDTKVKLNFVLHEFLGYEICSNDIVQNVSVQCKRTLPMWGVGIFLQRFCHFKGSFITVCVLEAYQTLVTK